MNFFQYQEQARKQSFRLMVLFSFIVLLIIFAVYAVVSLNIPWLDDSYQYSTFDFWDMQRFVWIAGVTSLLIVSGSLYKMQQLQQGGGAAVAELMGGQCLQPNSGDVLERRLINVTEEMAIAAGLPVPPVYLLPEQGINAFAAGFSPSDAVIGITQGALDLLNRDELQGVIAHEFSHILNGDILIKMRLMGMLHGITLIADTGSLLMTSRRSTRYSTRSKGSVPALAFLGLLLFAVGTVGLVLADLIKRAFSRQREYLADASAVQFTRNPSGLAGALKVIAGYKVGSNVRRQQAQSSSFLFFGSVLRSWSKTSWWSTHPSLHERILRLEPSFRGQVTNIDVEQRSTQVQQEAILAFSSQSETFNQAPQSRSDGVFFDTLAAQQSIAQIPVRIRDFAHDPCLARAVVYALLFTSVENKSKALRRKHLGILEEKAEAQVLREYLDIICQLESLAVEQRLPLLDLCMPALKSLSRQQYMRFIANVRALVLADGEYHAFEFMLQQILLQHLTPSFISAKPPKIKYHKITDVQQACVTVLAFVVQAASNVHRAHIDAMQRQVLKQFFSKHIQPIDMEGLSFHDLEQALQTLQHTSFYIREQLIVACKQCLLDDGKVDVLEHEIMRAIADAMGCPMPPLKIGIALA